MVSNTATFLSETHARIACRCYPFSKLLKDLAGLPRSAFCSVLHRARNADREVVQHAHGPMADWRLQRGSLSLDDGFGSGGTHRRRHHERNGRRLDSGLLADQRRRRRHAAEFLWLGTPFVRDGGGDAESVVQRSGDAVPRSRVHVTGVGLFQFRRPGRLLPSIQCRMACGELSAWRHGAPRPTVARRVSRPSHLDAAAGAGQLGRRRWLLRRSCRGSALHGFTTLRGVGEFANGTRAFNSSADGDWREFPRARLSSPLQGLSSGPHSRASAGRSQRRWLEHRTR